MPDIFTPALWPVSYTHLMFDVARTTANYTWRGKFTDGKNGELFEEFLKNGGPTGFTLLKSIEDYEKDVREIDRRARGSILAGDMWRIVTGGIDRFNQTVSYTHLDVYKRQAD